MTEAEAEEDEASAKKGRPIYERASSETGSFSPFRYARESGRALGGQQREREREKTCTVVRGY